MGGMERSVLATTSSQTHLDTTRAAVRAIFNGKDMMTIMCKEDWASIVYSIQTWDAKLHDETAKAKAGLHATKATAGFHATKATAVAEEKTEREASYRSAAELLARANATRVRDAAAGLREKAELQARAKANAELHATEERAKRAEETTAREAADRRAAELQRERAAKEAAKSDVASAIMAKALAEAASNADAKSADAELRSKSAATASGQPEETEMTTELATISGQIDRIMAAAGDWDSAFNTLVQSRIVSNSYAITNRAADDIWNAQTMADDMYAHARESRVHLQSAKSSLEDNRMTDAHASLVESRKWIESALVLEGELPNALTDAKTRADEDWEKSVINEKGKRVIKMPNFLFEVCYTVRVDNMGETAAAEEDDTSSRGLTQTPRSS
jgi:hypothetical protein